MKPKEEGEKMKAAIYARVSTAAQGEEDKASIPDQITKMERHCQDKGYIIADRYVDIGYSGAKSKRPEFQRMLRDAQAGKFDVIVCWKADRLSRGMYPAAALMEVIEPLGISLEAVEEHLDFNYFALLAVVGKMEIDNIAARTKIGREGRAKRGLHPGGWLVPYGYSLEQGKLVTNEAEALWISDLFLWVDSGKPARQWCIYANTHGFRSRNMSQGVTPQQASVWLRNPIYKGEYHWNKRTRKGLRKLSQTEHITIPCPAIVSPELWDRVQGKLRQNRQWSIGNAKNFYLLRKLLFCRECGKGFTCGTSHWRYYECYGTRNYPHLYQCRKPHRISADLLEKYVWNEVADGIRMLTDFTDALYEVANILDARKETIKQDLEREKQRLEKCYWQRQRIATRERQEYLSPREAELQYRAIKAEEEGHIEEIAKLEQMLHQDSTIDQLVDAAEWLGEQFNQWELSPFEGVVDKREVLVKMVDRITIDRNNQVEVRLKLGMPELTKMVASLSMHDTTWRITPL